MKRAYLIVACLVLAGCGGAATSSQAAAPTRTPIVTFPPNFSVAPLPSVATATYPPATPVPPPAAEGPPVFDIGYRTTITDNDGELGHITVLEAKKTDAISDFQEAEPGNVYAAVHVQYEATRPFYYNPFEWVSHDQDNRQFEVDSLGPEPALDSGDLSPGRKVDGWFSFQVPSGTRHLYLDYQNSDGSVVFVVPLF